MKCSKLKDWITKITKWLKKYEIYFKTVAATLISIMAVIVSCQQIKTAEKQNTILEKQTELTNKQFSLMSTQTVSALNQLKLTQNQIDLNKLQYINEIKYQELQLNLSKMQNDLIDTQTAVTTQLYKRQEIIDIIKRRQDYVSLNEAIMHLGVNMAHPLFSRMSDIEIKEYFESLLILLKSQQGNPLLVENQDCYKSWLHAIDTISSWALSTFDPKAHWRFPGSNPSDITSYIDSSQPREFSIERNKYLVKCDGIVHKDIDYVYEKLVKNQDSIKKLYTTDELKTIIKR